MTSPRQLGRSLLARVVARILIAGLLLSLVPPSAEASIPRAPLPEPRPLADLGTARSEPACLLVVVVLVADPIWLTKSAFGELLAHTGTDPQPYAFAGEPYDPNVGFQYHRARWMDPRVGRFLGMDPFRGRTQDPASLHKYAYSSADPLNRVDPTGRFFSSADIMSALGTLMVLSSIAVPKLVGTLNALAPLYFAALKVVFWADVGLTTLGAAEVAAGAILEGMATRLESTDITYPPGGGPRGLLVGRVAGQNLADDFPHIDDFDFQDGVATSIKSTTQVQSTAQLLKVIEGYAGEFDLIDDDLPGRDANGRPVVVPVNSIKMRNVLVAVPPLSGNVARGLPGGLRDIARVMQVNIRVVQVRGLRGP